MEAWIEICADPPLYESYNVASRVEAWIEILLPGKPAVGAPVASRVEAWIEIVRSWSCSRARTSPPAWRRGLKLGVSAPAIAKIEVASRVEAWIEIDCQKANHPHHYVAKRVEASIEKKTDTGPV